MILGLVGLSIALRAQPTPDPTPPLLPVETFFRRPELRDPQLSRDGTRLAFRLPNPKGYYSLATYDRKTRRSLGFDLGDLDVNDFAWASGDRLIFDVLVDQIFAHGLFAVRPSDRKLSVLSRHDVAIVVGLPTDEPHIAYVWLQQTQESRTPGLYRIDTRRSQDDTHGHVGFGAAVIGSIPLPPGAVLGFVTDRHDHPRLVHTFTEGQRRTWVRERGARTWEAIPLDFHLQVPLDFDATGRALFVLQRGPAGRVGLYLQPLTAAAPTEHLFTDDRYDLDNVTLKFSAQDHRLQGLGYWQAGPTVRWFDPEWEQVQADLDAALPERVNRILSRDEGEQTLLVHSATDRHPGRYYLYDRRRQELASLPDPTPWIDEGRLAKVRMIRYKTRDGLELEALVTMPAAPATDGRKPPLIVLPHGGPWARDGWGFDPEAQFLASRGYAVLQPNYRGSTGYGAAISDAPAFEFARMHDDVTDATRRLIRSGLIDPERIGILGTSFGGYLALCGVTKEPDLYRCAVSIAGVFDWAQLVRARGRDPVSGTYQREFLAELGDPVKDAAKFTAISPIHHLESVRVPVFVAHGRDDENVSAAQSRRLARALEQRGVPVTTFFRAWEGHGFRKPENLIELYTTLEAFLGQHLAAAPARTASTAPALTPEARGSTGE